MEEKTFGVTLQAQDRFSKFIYLFGIDIVLFLYVVEDVFCCYSRKYSQKNQPEKVKKRLFPYKSKIISTTVSAVESLRTQLLPLEDKLDTINCNSIYTFLTHH